MAEFDPKQITVPQWLAIGAGLLAFINSFLPWYSVSTDAALGGFSASLSGWNVGFLGIMSVLLLIAAGVLAALPLFGVSVPNGTMIWLGLAALAFVFTLLRWLTYDSATAGAGLSLSGISAGASFGTIFGLILAIASAAGGFLAYRGRNAANTA